MLESGTSIAACGPRPATFAASPPAQVAGDRILALAGLGQSGISQGFTALPEVSGYTATAGRYRLGPAGFVPCAADEERLCYKPDGTFSGQYLQGADTYHSAPWHDPGASHTTASHAYLSPSGASTIAYAGSHSQPDIFGGTGGGFTLTQASSANGFHTATNVKAGGVIPGDLIRYHAIVAITGQTGPSKVQLRGTNPGFGFDFDHDATGRITGFAENWGSYRAGFHDMGTINGKRWSYIWVDRRATSGSDAAIGIGHTTQAAQPGRTIHCCELMVQKNPASAPAAVPVCAADKVFAADTLVTGMADVGYSCIGLAMSRSRVLGGALEAPRVSLGVPYEPLETRIEIHDAQEAVDRTGVLPNANLRLYCRPWQAPADFRINYGPGYFPGQWLRVGDPGSNCADATITPVFTSRLDLRPILGRHSTSYSFITGTLTLDDCVFLGVGDPVSSYWEQVSIRGDQTASFFLQAGSGVSAKNALFMGASLHSTRARHQIQQDDGPDRQVYVGEVVPQINASGSVDMSGSRFERLARFTPGGTQMGTPVSLNIDDIAFDRIWSDFVYLGRGTYTNMQASRRFHGRTTHVGDMNLWQSRKEVEVDTGSGWTGFGASGLSLEDLPAGHLAQHVGTYDFTTDTFTAAPDQAKAVRLRYWETGSLASPAIGRPGYEWHASQMDMGHYTRSPDQGDVFEVDTGSLKLRVYYDHGYWSNGPVWNPTSAPAAGATGTHADNVQVNRIDVAINGGTGDSVVMLNRAQGMFHTGSNGAVPTGTSITGFTSSNVVAVLAQSSNGYRYDWSALADSTESLSNAVFIQSASAYRFANGTGIGLGLGCAGPNNTLNLGANVWFASGSANPVADSSGGTTAGTLNVIELPAATGYSGYTTPGPSHGLLANLFDPSAIDAVSGQPREVSDPWTFAFAGTAAATLGFDPNAVLALVKGNHARWDEVIADLAGTYFREPDHHVKLPANAAVGSVVVPTFAAGTFHARLSGNGEGYFAIEDGTVKVARSLSGVDRVFVLRGDNDETVVIDVS